MKVKQKWEATFTYHGTKHVIKASSWSEFVRKLYAVLGKEVPGAKGPTR